MSYDIIYQTCGFRCSKGVIPFILSGSNNCYTVSYNGREKRVRDWGNDFRFRKEDWLLTNNTLETLILYLKDKGEEKSTDIKFNGRFASYKHIIRMFQNIYKKAINIEDTKQNLYGKICEYNKFDGEVVTISSTEELNKYVEMALKANKWLYITASDFFEKPIIQKEIKNKNGDFVIKNGKFFYLEDNTWCSNPQDVKIFNSYDAAREYGNINFPYHKFNIVKFNPEWFTPKEYVLVSNDEKYYYSNSRNGFYYVCDKESAQKLSLKKAKQLMKRLSEKVPHNNFKIEKVAL